MRRVGDDLAGEGGIRPSRLFPWHRKNAGIGRPAYAGYQSEQHGACSTPYDLPAGQTREPDLHKDILNQKRVRETSTIPRMEAIAVARGSPFKPGDAVTLPLIFIQRRL